MKKIVEILNIKIIDFFITLKKINSNIYKCLGLLNSNSKDNDAINLQSSLFLDLLPGPSGSFPAFLHVHGVYLYFSSGGIDVSWMIEQEHTDTCNSYKQSTYDRKMFYAVSENTYWDVDRTYDCPLGFHWASTEEGFEHFTSHSDVDVEDQWHKDGGSGSGSGSDCYSYSLSHSYSN